MLPSGFIGDSQVFRFAGGELEQISKDHVVISAFGTKPPLSQNLGIPPDQLLIEPYLSQGRYKNAIKTKQLHVYNGKGGQERDIPFDTKEQTEVLEKILEYAKSKGKRSADYLFCDDHTHSVKRQKASFTNWMSNHLYNCCKFYTGETPLSDTLYRAAYTAATNDLLNRGILPFDNLQHGAYAEEHGNFTAIDLGFEIVNYRYTIV